MRTALVAVAALALSGCSILLERAPDYAVNALDSTADRATNVALDKAEDGVRNAGSDDGDDPEEEQVDPGEKVTRKLDSDDVLVKQGDDYLVGKQLGEKILMIRSGQKIDPAGAEVIPVRPAKKKDLQVGADAFFTTAKGDVRRAAWTPGSVTDDGQLGEGKVAVGPESELEWDGQVAVKR